LEEKKANSPLQIVSEAPAVVSEALTIASEAPAVVSEALQIAAEAPAVVSEALQIAAEAPALVSEALQIAAEAPAVVVSDTHFDGYDPSIEELSDEMKLNYVNKLVLRYNKEKLYGKYTRRLDAGLRKEKLEKQGLNIKEVDALLNGELSPTELSDIVTLYQTQKHTFMDVIKRGRPIIEFVTNFRLRPKSLGSHESPEIRSLFTETIDKIWDLQVQQNAFEFDLRIQQKRWTPSQMEEAQSKYIQYRENIYDLIYDFSRKKTVLLKKWEEQKASRSLQIAAEAPAVVSEAPAVVSEALQIAAEAPAVVSEAPAVVSEALQIAAEALAVASEAPAIVSEAPAVVSEALTIASEAPAIVVSDTNVIDVDDLQPLINMSGHSTWVRTNTGLIIPAVYANTPAVIDPQIVETQQNRSTRVSDRELNEGFGLPAELSWTAVSPQHQ
jgi:hypothetical protein